MIEAIVTSSVLIVMIIVLRRFLMGRISLRLQYALWVLVAIRLLLPFSLLSSPVSVMNAMSHKLEQSVANPYPPLVDRPDSIYMYTEHSTRDTVNSSEGIGKPDSNAAASYIKSDLMKNLLHLFWFIGFSFVVLCLIVANISFYLRLKKQAIPVKVDDCPLPVYLAQNLPSPCLYGIFKPAIYVTAESLESKERLRHILAHELTHYAHKDHLWSFVRGICIAIHWFNPLVWAAAVLSRRDCELACDEGTLLRLGEDSRVEYGRTLIGMMTTQGSPMDLLRGATTMTSGKSSIRERIILIAQKPKMKTVTLITVLLIATIIATCTFTGAVSRSSMNKAINLPINESNTKVLPDVENTAAQSTLDTVVSEAILNHNAKSYRGGEFKTESHVTLKTVEDQRSAVVYLMAYYAEFDFPDRKPVDVSGSHIPVALTFSKDDNGAYHLKEYWEASDGSYYFSSIKKKFPADLLEGVSQMQSNAERHYAVCLEKAKEYLRGRLSEEELFSEIISSPKQASSPNAYIAEHQEEYNTLISRGDTTLRYIFSRFIEGRQNGLEGWIMLSVGREILGDEDKPDSIGDFPQESFNNYVKLVKQLRDANSMEYMEKYYPGAYILLAMLNESSNA
ncbi:M56 family metallopeptidase [Cohnella abietis]|uniref:Peptidase M56 domain-containing protein n=1 Tax=Cohnella abietis TaxID=2507935 RepID=A0A3T1CYN4_9BACL|nr:M56 family metallopeptidase [Cohnella abietis]BBI30972.1 hypothetical protein KCTCHS21_03710 [Cohnella abietis]